MMEGLMTLTINIMKKANKIMKSNIMKLKIDFKIKKAIKTIIMQNIDTNNGIRDKNRNNFIKEKQSPSGKMIFILRLKLHNLNLSTTGMIKEKILNIYRLTLVVKI